MKTSRFLMPLFAAILVGAVWVSAAAADTRTISSSGTAHLAPAALGQDAIQQPEFLQQEEEANGTPFPNKPLGRQKKLFPGQTLPAPSIASSGVAAAAAGFDGLNFRQQRLANGGNQFSVEPPDQALCVGNGFVVEAVNTVLRVYSATGTALTGVQDLNTFYGYPPQIDRATGVQGAFITDPVCYFDPEHSRFVLVVLTLDVNDAGDNTGGNHLDVAVSNTGDPTGTWSIYKIQVADDGSAGTPKHHNCPCIGDYPHIGADANGVYLTTNEYSFFGTGFNGSQLYALPKAQLYSGGSLNVTQIENTRVSGSPGFTLAPATSNPGDYDQAGNGTEWFLSTVAGDGSETGNPTGSANKIVAWALRNTASLADKNPKPRLDSVIADSESYVFPPASNQKPGPFPLGQCLNDTSNLFGPGLGCWALLVDAQPASPEVESSPDSSDTREFQVWYRQGHLYGSAGTGVNVSGDNTTRAGVAWWEVVPTQRITGAAAHLSAAIVHQGYIGVAGNNVTYPAWAVRASDGKGVMAFTVMGNDHYPSAGYAVYDSSTGTFGNVTIAAEGLGPDDGFTGYKALVGDPPRPRWGDYGAAVTDGDSVWIASEYIAQTCTLAQWLTAPIGSCGGTRATLGNWATHITKVTP
ncbi:MAG: hypothetical protein H0X39_13810 [Actinobacteria bacterium]|nr:hypothetical protein [Actinomycetota bacterium]